MNISDLFFRSSNQSGYVYCDGVPLQIPEKIHRTDIFIIIGRAQKMFNMQSGPLRVAQEYSDYLIHDYGINLLKW